MAKGAAMLAPALATMLAVVTTDAVADSAALDRVLRAATRGSFDRVDTDGCMSTNDTVLLLASGASGVTPDEADLQRGGQRRLRRTSPGRWSATPRAPTRTSPSRSSAPRARTTRWRPARAVARSNLLKCALHGNDPNWGRVLSAVGTTARRLRAGRPRRRHQRRAGLPGRRARRRPRRWSTSPAARSRSSSTCTPARTTATIWTSDLTADYVHENSAYST